MPLPALSGEDPIGGRAFNAFARVGDVLNSLKAQQIANQFAPLTNQANAMSKMTYSNLMGPQFLAKLMGNQDIIANLPEDKRQQALNMLYQAGTSQGMVSQPSDQNKSMTSFLEDNLRNAFSKGQQNQNILSSQDQNAINRLQPGQSYVVQGSQPQQNALQQIPSIVNQPPEQTGTFAENVGRYKGIEEEGKESGKIRATDIQDLNNTYFNAQTKQATLDDITGILASPEFEQIRQFPIAGKHELSYYAKFGTPEQQQLAGRYFTDVGKLVADSSKDFAGQFRKGEQQLLNGIKPNSSDTVNSARGKTEALSLMNQLVMERSKMTSELMSKYHMNKLQAQEVADKQINGEQIRQQIHDKINPMVRIRNKKTGEVVSVPISEARKRGIENV